MCADLLVCVSCILLLLVIFFFQVLVFGFPGLEPSVLVVIHVPGLLSFICGALDSFPFGGRKTSRRSPRSFQYLKPCGITVVDIANQLQVCVQQLPAFSFHFYAIMTWSQSCSALQQAVLPYLLPCSCFELYIRWGRCKGVS